MSKSNSNKRHCEAIERGRYCGAPAVYVHKPSQSKLALCEKHKRRVKQLSQ